MFHTAQRKETCDHTINSVTCSILPTENVQRHQLNNTTTPVFDILTLKDNLIANGVALFPLFASPGNITVIVF